MRGERDGLSGPFATAARGTEAPGEALEGSHDPEAMREERDGQPGPIATAARGKAAPGEVTKKSHPRRQRREKDHPRARVRRRRTRSSYGCQVIGGGNLDGRLNRPALPQCSLAPQPALAPAGRLACCRRRGFNGRPRFRTRVFLLYEEQEHQSAGA